MLAHLLSVAVISASLLLSVSGQTAISDIRLERFSSPSQSQTQPPVGFGPPSIPVPKFSNQYYLEGTLSLPYADLKEPVAVWFDGVKQRGRVEYYNGLDKFVMRTDLNTTWKVAPYFNDVACFTDNSGPPALTNLIPDFTPFSLASSEPVTMNGVSTWNWIYIDIEGSTKNIYNFYTDVDSGHPVKFHMLGADYILGSHFDEYIIDYSLYSEDPSHLDDSHFVQPLAQCGSFPGPGATETYSAPPSEFAHIFPSADGSSKPSSDFSRYIASFGKSYSGAEAVSRSKVFHSNVRYINSHNRMASQGKKTFTMAVNHLADLSDKEMEFRRGARGNRVRRSDNGADKIHQITLAPSDRPTEIDWRTKGAVNQVKDQAVCGSCWSFGTAGTIEGAYFLKTGKLVKFSEQQLMDCSWLQGNNACDGGEDFRAYEWILQNGGLASTDLYGPYLGQDGKCNPHPWVNSIDGKIVQGDVAKLAGYVNVTAYDENSLLDAIATQGPVSVAINAALKSFDFYSSGVYSDPTCTGSPADLDHAVLAVGYGTDAASGTDYWLVRNSWSTYWGDQGYVKIARKNNICGVATSPTYVTLQ